MAGCGVVDCSGELGGLSLYSSGTTTTACAAARPIFTVQPVLTGQYLQISKVKICDWKLDCQPTGKITKDVCLFVVWTAV